MERTSSLMDFFFFVVVPTHRFDEQMFPALMDGLNRRKDSNIGNKLSLLPA
jgi:hypothetical protein